MTAATLRRLGVPLAIAVAIVLSYRRPPAAPPIELAPGAPTGPSVGEQEAAFQRALAPGAPGYDRGATTAPVTVLEFADFGCRYCARFATETYPALATEFVRTGRVRWRYVPFVLGMFPNGDEAARTAVCAAEQGPAAFARMHDRLYRLYGEWTAAREPASVFRAYAEATRLDAARFAACWAGAAAGARIEAANELADRLGVRATPTFFINGYRLEGALPIEQFRAVLTDALQQSRTN